MLTDEQTTDLLQLQAVAERFSAEVAIIGAVALLCFIDLHRFTRDIRFHPSLKSRDGRRSRAESIDGGDRSARSLTCCLLELEEDTLRFHMRLRAFERGFDAGRQVPLKTAVK